mgnify:CR=1 FL=1
MSDQEKQLERRPQVSPTISAWRRYLQPLVGGALVFLVVLVVDIIVHFLVAQALHIHYEVSLGPIHSSVASAAASVSALVAGAGAALVEDRVLDKTANAPMWLAGCVLASILYLVLDILLLNML